MDGDSFVEMLCPYVDGELSVAERQELEAHLAGCQSCREELDGLGALVQQLRELPVLSAPPELLASVRRGFDEASAGRAAPRRARVFLRRAFAIAAGLLLALWVGLGPPVQPPQAPEERDQADLLGREKDELIEKSGPRDGAAGGVDDRDLSLPPSAPAPAEDDAEEGHDPDPRATGRAQPEAANADGMYEAPGAAHTEAEQPDAGVAAAEHKAGPERVEVLLAELEESINDGRALLAEVSEQEMPRLLSRLEELPGVELDLKDLRARDANSFSGASVQQAQNEGAWLFDAERRRGARPGAVPPPAPGAPQLADADEAEPQRREMGSAAPAAVADSLDVFGAILREGFAADTVGLTSVEVRWLLRLLEMPTHDNRRQILFLWEAIDPGIEVRERAAAEAWAKQRFEALESARE